MISLLRKCDTDINNGKNNVSDKNSKVGDDKNSKVGDDKNKTTNKKWQFIYKSISDYSGIYLDSRSKIVLIQPHNKYSVMYEQNESIITQLCEWKKQELFEIGHMIDPVKFNNYKQLNCGIYELATMILKSYKSCASELMDLISDKYGIPARINIFQSLPKLRTSNVEGIYVSIPFLFTIHHPYRPKLCSESWIFKEESKLLFCGKDLIKCNLEFMVTFRVLDLVWSDTSDPNDFTMNLQAICTRYKFDRNKFSPTLKFVYEEFVNHLKCNFGRHKIVCEGLFHEWFEESNLLDFRSYDLLLANVMDYSEEKMNSDHILNVKISDLSMDVKSSDLSMDVKSSDLSMDVKSSDLSMDVKNSDRLPDTKNSNVLLDVENSHLIIDNKNSDGLPDAKNSNVLLDDRSSYLVIDNKNSDGLLDTNVPLAESGSLDVKSDNQVLYIRNCGNKSQMKYASNTKLLETVIIKFHRNEFLNWYDNFYNLVQGKYVDLKPRELNLNICGALTLYCRKMVDSGIVIIILDYSTEIDVDDKCENHWII